MKRFNKYLGELREHMFDVYLIHPNDILEYLDQYPEYSRMLLLVRNSDKIAKQVFDAANKILKDESQDIWLTTLIVILSHSERIEYASFLSRAVQALGRESWANVMALTFLLNQQDLDDKKLCLFA